MAVPMDKVEFTRENYDKMFPKGYVNTPIGWVKQGKNQYQKLIGKERKEYLGAIYQTLTDPIVILDEIQGEEKANLYIKSFKDEGKQTYIMAVAVNINKGKIIISAGPRKLKQIKHKMETVGSPPYIKGGGGDQTHGTGGDKPSLPGTTPQRAGSAGTEATADNSLSATDQNKSSDEPLFQEEAEVSAIRKIQAEFNKKGGTIENSFYSGEVEAVFTAKERGSEEDSYEGEFDFDSDDDDDGIAARDELIEKYHRAMDLAKDRMETGKWTAASKEDKGLIAWITPAFDAGLLVFDELADVGAEPETKSEAPKAKPETKGKEKTDITTSEADARFLDLMGNKEEREKFLNAIAESQIEEDYEVEPETEEAYAQQVERAKNSARVRNMLPGSFWIGANRAGSGRNLSTAPCVFRVLPVLSLKTRITITSRKCPCNKELFLIDFSYGNRAQRSHFIT
jgi:hypothetical protein